MRRPRLRPANSIERVSMSCWARQLAPLAVLHFAGTGRVRFSLTLIPRLPSGG